MRKIDSPFLISVICTSSIFHGCSVFEPASPVASYIHIDSISASTDYPTQGSNSSKVYDAWVIVDNKYLGTFPLPADVPVIGEGSHFISVKAGIVENGIAAARTSYPKYASYDTTLSLTAKNNITLTPVVRYLSGVQFPQIEDFDDASLSLVNTSSGIANLNITPAGDPNAFEGNSGFVTLRDTSSVFEVASSAPFQLPLNTPSYLELNYKGEAAFTIGVFVSTVNGITKSDLVTIRASTVWKKIYIDLSETGGVLSNGTDYKIFLHAVKDAGITSENLYFDNLKVVY